MAIILGTSGTDQLFGEAGSNDSLSGDAGNDFIFGYEGEDVLAGDAGNDEIWGGLDRDFMSGGSGNDLLAGEEGDDIITPGDGDDTVLISPNGGYDTLQEFDIGQDTLLFRGFQDIQTFRDLSPHIRTVGNDTVIDIAEAVGDGGRDTVFLLEVQGLTARDFDFIN